MTPLDEFAAFRRGLIAVRPAADYVVACLRGLSIRHGTGSPLVRLDVELTACSPIEESHWRCIADGVLDWRVERCDWNLWLELADEHPLLWGFQDVAAELSFTGEVDDAAAAEIDLRRVHQETEEPWIAFGRYLNLRNGRPIAATARYGIAASGPLRVVGRYSAVLEDHGLQTQILAQRRPAAQPNWAPDEPVPWVLLLDSGQFVIAKHLRMERVE